MNHIKKKVFLVTSTLTLTLLILNSIGVLPTKTQVALANDHEWRLEIVGLVDNSLSLTIEEIVAMPKTTVQATIYCVDFPNQLVTTGNWTGVKLTFLLEKAGLSQSATKVAFFASDGYSTDLTLEAANQPTVIVAYEKDGAPLGEMLRLVVPGRWGYKWISQLTRIEIVDFDFKGKWESLGYSDYGNETGVGRISVPAGPNISNPTIIEENGTILSPTTPTPPNASSNLLPEKTQNSAAETPEVENPKPFSKASIAAFSAASVAIAVTAMSIYLTKRRQ